MLSKRMTVTTYSRGAKTIALVSIALAFFLFTLGIAQEMPQQESVGKKSTEQTFKPIVFGGTRNVGFALVQKCIDLDIDVTLFAFNKKKAERLFATCKGVTIVQGRVDGNPQAVKDAAKGKTHIFHCPDFPYKQWQTAMSRAVDNVIAAAKEHNALLIFPSTVYVFNETPLPANEETIIRMPKSSHGKVLYTVEKKLYQAAKSGDIKALIMRHATLFGPNCLNGLTDRVFESAIDKKPLPWINRVDIPLQVSYAPDVASAMVYASQKKSLGNFTLYHHVSHIASSVSEWLQDIALQAKIPFSTTCDSGWRISLMAAFQDGAHAAKDIYYSFEQALILDTTKLDSEFHHLPKTPYKQAIYETLQWFRLYKALQ